MTIKDNIITADEGKVFVRKEDGMKYGKEIVLGYTYYIGGVKLDEPHKDVPEDFEEIDEQINDNEDNE